ncbi:hypothetical protein G3N57_03085 [Paraburkholderia sp. Se-20369]|nr:hypothetical protein [Paraburkholderia sp. Se-20369]
MKVYDEAKAEFSRFGPVSRERVVDALECVLVSGSWLEHWGKLIPQEVHLDDATNKGKYLHNLFVSLTGREPGSEFSTFDAEITDKVGPDGLTLNK